MPSLPTKPWLFLIMKVSALMLANSAPGDVYDGSWWKAYLSSTKGHAWFHHWNVPLQSKFTELGNMAQAEADRQPGVDMPPYQVIMMGDSTMRHQFGVVCAYLGERPGRRFDPKLGQRGPPGCCVDTAPGGGRGICFVYDEYRFLNPYHAAEQRADALYFGSGMHLLHMAPAQPLVPLKIQQWLAYEKLLEDQVHAARRGNGPASRIIFMTTHAITDSKYTGAFARIRNAYRAQPGHPETRALCEEQVGHAVVAEPAGIPPNYEGKISLEGYPRGEGNFTPDSYCALGLLDSVGVVQLNSRARRVMARLGVPLVDAYQIVEGQAWATERDDGRHYHPMVPLEVLSLLGLLTTWPTVIEGSARRKLDGGPDGTWWLPSNESWLGQGRE